MTSSNLENGPPFIFTDKSKPLTGKVGEDTEHYTHIGYIEFYITHECNLTCRNCNRYNNYNFKGHFFVEDSLTELQAWSKRIDASHKTIIGGEPTLHPHLKKWLEVVRELWPNGAVMYQSNGLKDVPEIEEDTRWGVGIAIHDERMNLAKNKPAVNELAFFDATVFTDCALVDQGDYFTVHDSDPALAFQMCSMKHSHTMFNGKLYKCPMPAILPEFMKQYDVRLNTDQQALLDAYKPLSSDCSEQELRDFVDNQETHIPQCRLCPAARNEAKLDFDINRKKRKRLKENNQ